MRFGTKRKMFSSDIAFNLIYLLCAALSIRTLPVLLMTMRHLLDTTFIRQDAIKHEKLGRLLDTVFVRQVALKRRIMCC